MSDDYKNHLKQSFDITIVDDPQVKTKPKEEKEEESYITRVYLLEAELNLCGKEDDWGVSIWYQKGVVYGVGVSFFTISGIAAMSEEEQNAAGFDIGFDIGFHFTSAANNEEGLMNFINSLAVNLGPFDFTLRDRPDSFWFDFGSNFGQSMGAAVKSLSPDNVDMISLATDEFEESIHLFGDLYWNNRDPSNEIIDIKTSNLAPTAHFYVYDSNFIPDENIYKGLLGWKSSGGKSGEYNIDMFGKKTEKGINWQSQKYIDACEN